MLLKLKITFKWKNNADCVLKIIKLLGWTNFNIIYYFRICCQEGPTTIHIFFQEMLLGGANYNTIHCLGNVARRGQLQYNILFRKCCQEGPTTIHIFFQEMLLGGANCDNIWFRKCCYGGTNYNTIYCLGNVARRDQLQYNILFRKCCQEGPTTIQYIVLGNVARRDQLQYNILFRKCYQEGPTTTIFRILHHRNNPLQKTVKRFCTPETFGLFQ